MDGTPEEQFERKWEGFLAISNTCVDEKLSALDDFLSYFMSGYHDFDSDARLQIIRDLNGMSSTLTRQFLRDVHAICLKSTTKDEEKLMEYLINGRGATILCALERVGVQEITCNWEIANLLLSILAAFQNHTFKESAESLFANELKVCLQTNSCTDDVIPVAQLYDGTTRCFATATAYDSLLHNYITKELRRHRSIRPGCNKPPQAQVKVTEEPISESADYCYQPSSAKCVLDCVFSLLQQLYQNGIRGVPLPSLSSMVLTIMLDLLKISGDHPVNNNSLSMPSAYLTQRIALFIVSTSVNPSSVSMEVLQKSNLFSSFFRIIEKRLQYLDSLMAHDTYRSSIACQEIFNCAFSSVTILRSIISSKTYVEFIDIFSCFLKGGGPNALSNSLTCLHHNLADEIIRDFAPQLVHLIGDVGARVRNARMNAYHAELGENNCLKKWKLTYTAYHHVLEGIHFGFIKNYNAAQCPVASMANILLTLLSAAQDESFVLSTLTALRKCGVCCCINLKQLYTRILSNLNKYGTVQHLEIAMQILENAVIAFSNQYVTFDCTIVICLQCDIRLTSEERVVEQRIQSLKSDKSLKIAETDYFKNGCWNIFNFYLDLLLQSDLPLFQVLEKHLFDILVYASENLQTEMYLRIFLPLSTYISTGCEGREPDFNDVLVSFCLNGIIFLSKLPDSYPLLMASTCIENVFKHMCASSLRQTVLRLLRLAMLEETKLLGSEIENFGLCIAKVGDVLPAESVEKCCAISTLKMYQEVLMHHTRWYRNFIKSCFQRLSDTDAAHLELDQSEVEICVDGRGQHKEGDSVLPCLNDLWKTVCYICDHSAACRQFFWDASIRAVVFDIILQFVAQNDGNAAPVVSEIEWKLLGSLLHVAFACELPDKQSRSCENVETSVTRLLLALRQKLSMKMAEDDIQKVSWIFQSLLAASLQTDIPNIKGIGRSSISTFNHDSRDYGMPPEESSSIWSSTSSLERGYDADIEEDIASKLFRHTSLNTLHVSDTAGPVTCTVLFPEILRLLLDLAVTYKSSLLKDESCACSSVEAASNLSLLVQDLVQICNLNYLNSKTLLYDCKIIEMILVEFHDVLTSPDVSADLRLALLDLFAACSQHRILTWELGAYLKLLVHPYFLAKKGLEILNGLIERIKAQPPHFIQFQLGPRTDATTESTLHRAKDFSTSSSAFKHEEDYHHSSIGKGKTKIENTLASCRHAVADTVVQHKSKSLSSSFAKLCIAACFPPSEDVSFWLGGLGVSCWLNLGESVSSNPKASEIHLLSIGSENLMLELWSNPSKNCLVLKLAISSKHTYTTLSEKALTIRLKAETWHHLCISWMAIKKVNSKLVLQVFLHLDPKDDDTAETVPLECQWQDAWQHSRPFVLLLGHSESDIAEGASWALGNLMIFQGPFLNDAAPALLSLLGPSCTQLELLRNIEISPWAQNSAKAESALHYLKNKLLARYLPQNSNIFLMHASEQISLPVLQLGNFKHMRSDGLEVSVIRVGGPSVFISLFAHIVEQHHSEDVQSECLLALVNLTLRSPHFLVNFLQASGWNLVLKVMSSSKCIIGCKMLSVLLRACMSESFLLHDPLDHHWKLNKLTFAVVTSAELLSLLLKYWKIFQGRQTDMLCWLLKVFELIVQEHHPKRTLNLEILDSLNLVQCLLTLCKESMLEDQMKLSPKVCRVIVRLIRTFNDRRPDADHLKKLTDFLIAVHPPNKTYVCHARSSFYFLLARSSLKSRPTSGSSTIQSYRSSEFLNLSKQTKAIANEKLRRSASAASNRYMLGGASSFSESENIGIYQDRDSAEATGSHNEGFLTANSSFTSLKIGDSIKEDWDEPVINEELRSSNSLIETLHAAPGMPKGNDESMLEELPESCCEAERPELIDEVFESFKLTEELDHMPAANFSILLQGVLETIGLAIEKDSKAQMTNSVDLQIFVVLALHPHECIRTEVIKVWGKYLKHATEEQNTNVTKTHLLNLLSNQLYQYEAAASLVEICIGLLIRDTFSFGLWDGSAPLTINLWNPAAIPLILAVLPRCHLESITCQKFLNFLIKFCRHKSTAYKEFVNRGLLQSLCLTISAIKQSGSGSIVTYNEKDKNSIMECIHTLLSDVMVYFVSHSGVHTTLFCSDLLTLLSHYEQIEIQQYGMGSSGALAFRNCQCSCLNQAFAIIRSHFEWKDEVLMRTTKDGKVKGASAVGVSGRKSTSSELKERFRELIEKAVDFLVCADSASDELLVSYHEISFSQDLVKLLLDGCLAVLNKRQSEVMLWHSLVFATHECLRAQLGRLLVFLLSPTQPVGQRLDIIDILLSRPRHIELMNYILKTNVKVEQRFLVFMQTLVRDNFENIEDVEMIKCVAISNELEKLCGYSYGRPLPTFNKEDWIQESYQNKCMWLRMQTTLVERISQKLEAFFKTLEKAAIVVTCSVADKQNQQRQLFLAHVKQQLSEQLQTNRAWQSLIQHLTHERAIWHCKDDDFQSWELDPTEAPHRVRKRLKPYQLHVNKRFLMPEHRYKLRSEPRPPRFSYLFENDDNSNDLATIRDELNNAEKIRDTYQCIIITPSTEAQGELLLGTNSVYYIGEETSSLKTHAASQSDVVSYTWHFNDIREMLKRRFQLQDNALELFLINGKTFLIAFSSLQERNTLYEQLTASNLQNLLIENDNLVAHTQMWRDRMITNFEYLTQLNKFAGRSFNDLMQYPVFPFILADYCSKVLNFANPKSFRNLAKPMAVQNESREEHYINQYTFLKKEQAGTDNGESFMPVSTPYHYGSHYSNSGIVLHFLVRLPPFTSMFLSYQDDNFDIPDRTFHSINTSWRLSSADSTTDVKELIPEFFFLPEMLINAEGFDFGIRQSGDRVDDVSLPPWCRYDPRLFILIHRQALESSYVTERLHQWIDLVFGYKQMGKAAVESINVFHPATYYGFDVDQIKDPLGQNAMRTMIKTFGQTPCQLFRFPHPMISLSLTHQHQQEQRLKVMNEVPGLCWGSYVGSPDEPEPTVILRRRHSQPMGDFVPMVTNEVFGLLDKTSLLVQYCKDKGISMINTTYVTCAALVIHGYDDGVIRLQLRRDRPSKAFISTNNADPVTCCSTAPDCPLLFVGKCSGSILVYKVSFELSKIGIHPDVVLGDSAVELFGHNDAISIICICKNFSIVVSASKDKTCIIWDLNRLLYVRSIIMHKNAVELVRVSDTSGDIASVSNSATGGCLLLHTINVKFVGRVDTTEKIHSICFSCVAEGISVNAICAGLANGDIMMWSTWDLLPIRTMRFEKFNNPVVSLAYSLDCQHLYAAGSDGVFIICESSSKKNTAVPKFRTLI